MTSPDKKADFSNVTGGSRSTEQPGRPDFSNVQSGASSTEEAQGERTYTVTKGDTLSRISQSHYGKASKWKVIFDANRDQLDNPDLIQPGQELRIPPLDLDDDGDPDRRG